MVVVSPQPTGQKMNDGPVTSANTKFPREAFYGYVRLSRNGARERAAQHLEGADLHKDGYKGRLCLTDGGVYDNLGLEPIWKRYRTILVSDGGRELPGNPLPRSNWFSQALRVSDIALQKGIFLRQRVLRRLDRKGERKLVSWRIREGVAAHGSDDTLNFLEDDTKRAV